MLLYHNGRSLRVLLQLTGSVLRNIKWAILFLIVYGVAIVWILRQGYLEYAIDHSHSLRNAYAPQSFGVLSAFVVCFRTHIAWHRYWEACSTGTEMFVKWSDAYCQVVSFCNATLSHLTDDQEQMREDIDFWKCTLAHWYSLLAALASDRLINGDISEVENRDAVASWRERVIRREDLRQIHRKNRGVIPLPDFTCYDLIKPNDAKLNVDDKPTSWIRRINFDDLDSKPHIPVLLKLSQIEEDTLLENSDRPFRVFGWILEGTTRLQKYLDTPPPVYSRVYQELSAGNLAYNHARKLADIPFPFIFTQLLGCMIVVACLLVPLFAALLSFQSDQEISYSSVLLSSLVCIPLVGLNEMSKELENPFGTDPNDVPLLEGLECFVECLVDTYGSELPKDHLPVSETDKAMISESLDRVIEAKRNSADVGNLNDYFLLDPVAKLNSPAQGCVRASRANLLDRNILTNLTPFLGSGAKFLTAAQLEEHARKIRNAPTMSKVMAAKKQKAMSKLRAVRSFSMLLPGSVKEAVSSIEEETKLVPKKPEEEKEEPKVVPKKPEEEKEEPKVVPKKPEKEKGESKDEGGGEPIEIKEDPKLVVDADKPIEVKKEESRSSSVVSHRAYTFRPEKIEIDSRKSHKLSLIDKSGLTTRARTASPSRYRNLR